MDSNNPLSSYQFMVRVIECYITLKISNWKQYSDLIQDGKMWSPTDMNPKMFIKVRQLCYYSGCVWILGYIVVTTNIIHMLWITFASIWTLTAFVIRSATFSLLEVCPANAPFLHGKKLNYTFSSKWILSWWSYKHAVHLNSHHPQFLPNTSHDIYTLLHSNKFSTLQWCFSHGLG